jgi:Homeodomain-like domain-containing protein
MFGRETRMLLRHYLEQGTSKSALARQLGVHRDTIHRWIRAGGLDRDLDEAPVRYGPRAPGPTKLDAFKPIIEARLAAYSDFQPAKLSNFGPALTLGTERSVRVLLGVARSQSEAITPARQRQRLNWGAGHCRRLSDTRKHFDTRRSQTAS